MVDLERNENENGNENGNRFRFQVIQYFTNREAKIISFFRDSNLTEDQFLDLLLNNMRRETLEELERLSICQYCENESQVLPWINSCYGRVYRDGTDILSQKFNQKIRDLLA